MKRKAKGTLNRIGFEMYFSGNVTRQMNPHPAKSSRKSLISFGFSIWLANRLTPMRRCLLSEKRGVLVEK